MECLRAPMSGAVCELVWASIPNARRKGVRHAGANRRRHQMGPARWSIADVDARCTNRTTYHFGFALLDLGMLAGLLLQTGCGVRNSRGSAYVRRISSRSHVRGVGVPHAREDVRGAARILVDELVARTSGA
ncbi:hypothetical protein OH77DRAFT_1283252 [Trametes cingulata]|nr:hypothetical protein OH77DRAFT_1283252 [Trametes cingulata]